MSNTPAHSLVSKGSSYTQVAGSAAEMTDRKDTESLLQYSAEETRRINDELAFYKFALDEAAIVAVTDSAGTISYINDKFCRISGYQREELLGKDQRLLYSSI